jgi:DNA-binding CsgD family transcriptional regulator
MSAGSAGKTFYTLLALDHDLRDDLRLGAQPTVTTLVEAIAIAEETTAAALSDPSAKNDAARARLITACLSAQSDARGLLLSERSRRLSAIARSITRLRAVSSVDALIRQTCAELTGPLAFRCASYSIIDSGGYSVRRVHPGDSMRQQDSAIHRLSPAELRCVQARRPTVVDGTSMPADSMARLLGATNYVVAPVIIRSEVAGLIHAARALPWTVDAVDAKLLDVIASAFAVVHQREARTDRMQRQRKAIFDAARQLVTDAETLTGADIDLDIGDESASRPETAAPPRAALRELLTPREAEVLNLIVVGASNNEIADQLVITVETVKSHVKKVLRKLGAVNRAEAISLYLDDTRSAPR